MIFGPKAGGTYVIEFKTAAGEALDLNPQDRDDSGPALPGAYALWAVRAGRSVRNLWRAHGVHQAEPSNSCLKPVHEGSRDPARANLPLDCDTRAGFSFAR
jgi:hypothetical protein